MAITEQSPAARPHAPNPVLAVLACLALSLPASAQGADVGLAGLFPGKALLTINGGPPRTVPLGVPTAEGVKVVAIDGDTATIEVDGKRRVLRVGQNVSSKTSDSGPATAVLTADASGHFFTTGYVNGAAVRFMVDTGASMIALSASDAQRAGVNISQGKKAYFSTANGLIEATQVKLNSVRVGDITLHNVDASVQAAGLPYTLLGMSFLNRMEMQRSGDTMTLKKRF